MLNKGSKQGSRGAYITAGLLAALFVLSSFAFLPGTDAGASSVEPASHVRPLVGPTVTNISYVSTIDALTLSYLQYLPATFSNATTYPLVVFLHGAGTGVTENITGGVGGVQNPGRLQNNSSVYGYIEISLNTRTTQPYYINTPCGGPQAQDVIDAINSEKRLNKVSSIYVVGFSAGSSGALIMAGHKLIPGLAGIATTGTISDLFEEFDYLNTTSSSAHYTGWAVAECNHFLSPQNTTQVRTAAYESVFRFHPENFTGIKVWISSGAKDTTAENKYVSWPTYQQTNSTTLNASASVSLGLGEPLNTSKSYWNLSGGVNTVIDWNSACGHAYDQLPYGKMFEFFDGRLASGFYQDTVCPSNNATFAPMGSLPLTTVPTTPMTPPAVHVPRQTPSFACGTGGGGASGLGAINTMKGDSLLVLVALGAQKVSTVTDVAGDTFARQAIGFHVGSDRVEAWAVNSSKGSPNNQVTVGNSASGQFCLYYADFNFTNAHGFDVTGTNGTGTSTTCSSTVTTTSPNDLVLLVCMVSANVVISSGTGTVLSQNGASRSTAIADEATTTAGAYSPTVTFTSNAWAGLAVAVHPIVIPPTVTSLSGAPTSTSVALSWDNPSTILVDDIVNWGVNCSGGTTVQEFVVAGATVSGLSPSTTYCFWVQTVNLTGISKSVAYLNVTTQSANNGGGGFWANGEFNFAPLILLAFVVLILVALLGKLDVWERIRV